MKKKIVFFIVMAVLFLSYVIVIQLMQYYPQKTNVYICLSNNSYELDSVDFKVYLDGRLITDCVKGKHPHPYYEEFGIDVDLGKHIVTVEANKGSIKKEFPLTVFFVKYVRISFYDTDVYPEIDPSSDREFEVSFVSESIFLPYRLVQ